MEEILRLPNTISAQIIEMGDNRVERGVFWDDPTHGFLCKCKPDVDNPNLKFLADLKSTISAAPTNFAKSCANFNYDTQAAHYLTGINQATGEHYQDFLFIAQEKTEPFAVAVYRADQEMVDNGRAKIRPLLPVYAECLKTGVWPAYDNTQISDLSLPYWALTT